MSSRALGMASVVGVGHTSCVLEHEVWGYHSPGTIGPFHEVLRCVDLVLLALRCVFGWR